MRTRVFGTTVLFLLFVSPGTTAQSVEHGDIAFDVSDIDSLLRVVVASTSRFDNQRVAINEGYHKIGPDFPGMGEHWINFRFLLNHEIDPKRPPIITYLPVNGSAIFTGVAFAMPAVEGDVPDEVPLAHLWHFHSGTIDEETLFLNPSAMSHDHDSSPKLSMMHVWTGVSNPAGPMQQDNWALPFIRLSIDPPEDPSPKAGKALFLLSGGVEYYAKLIDLASDLSGTESDSVTAVIRSSRVEVEDTVAECLEGAPVEKAHLAELAEIWDAMWSRIRRGLPASKWSRVASLSG